MTKKTRHSPGPWKVLHQPLRPQFSGSRIIEVQTFWGEAIVAWSGFDGVDQPKGVRLANARLMAASPLLLAAARHAEAVLSIVEPRSDQKEYLKTLTELRAAIAAAT